MRNLALLAALIAVPLTAAAEDGGPPEPPPDEAALEAVGDAPDGVTLSNDAAATNGPATASGPTTTTTTTTAPDGTTTTTTITAPGAAPAMPVAPVTVDEDPCGVHSHARWRHRMKGRLSIGFSKSHIELDGEDGADEGKQKSFVARLNGRRGWSIELELSKLTLDGGDAARTAGVSLVKTFGRRRIAPYVLAGGGGGRLEHADGTEQKLGFGEVGGGVMLRGKRFSIGFDMRRGVRKLRENEDELMRVSMPTGEDDHEHDHYTRGRVLALFNF